MVNPNLDNHNNNPNLDNHNNNPNLDNHNNNPNLDNPNNNPNLDNRNNNMVSNKIVYLKTNIQYFHNKIQFNNLNKCNFSHPNNKFIKLNSR